MNPKQLFETGLQYHHYANTAYPLTPGSFKAYRLKDRSKHVDFLKDEWAKAKELSLYVHIPFCQVRCKFCEYAVLEDVQNHTEDLYVSLLLKEFEMYQSIIKDKPIIGYDLGGGTPTKLSIENLQKITDALTESFNFKEDTVFSIETTPIIAAREPDKIEAVYKMGYKRISMGIQTISEKLLNELGREGTTHIYEKATSNIRKAGYKMFNIDLMYGFLHQSEDDFENTIRYAIGLKPEYITLYRNRYKGTKLEKEAGGVSLYKIISQYRLAYKLLIENGYYANVGKNTFSRVENDYGTSDYLTKRVIYGVPYVGMGLGAQSFGIDYLAYNEGAANKQLAKYKQKIENNEIPIQDIYSLPVEESIGKMVSVAFYFAFIDLQAFQNRFGISFAEHFKEEIAFVLKEDLMEMQGNRIVLTNRGADYINGIIPLFYSNQAKKELLKLYEKSKTQPDGEAEFLKAYNIREFEQPSIATDIVIFVQNNEENKSSHSVVMIKRGEHPFMNAWALPGGFVRPNESVEQTAHRELQEETGITEIQLDQLQVFSEPKRDPRGWIISCAFTGIARPEDINLKFGDDAIDSQLFSIKLSKKEAAKEYCSQDAECTEYILELFSDQLKLSAEIVKETIYLQNGDKTNYKVLKSDGIAFDHAKILLIAMEKQGFV
jgi:oxygen-independent coproporphyrinogen III oxidase